MRDRLLWQDKSPAAVRAHPKAVDVPCGPHHTARNRRISFPFQRVVSGRVLAGHRWGALVRSQQPDLSTNGTIDEEELLKFYETENEQLRDTLARYNEVLEKLQILHARYNHLKKRALDSRLIQRLPIDDPGAGLEEPTSIGPDTVLAAEQLEVGLSVPSYGDYSVRAADLMYNGAAAIALSEAPAAEDEETADVPILEGDPTLAEDHLYVLADVGDAHGWAEPPGEQGLRDGGGEPMVPRFDPLPYPPTTSRTAPPLPPMDLIFVTAEVAPWSKTGGLGDVMGALPRALAMRGHRVMVVAPRYRTGDNDPLYASTHPLQCPTTINLHQGGQHQVDYHHVHQDHVDYIFVEHISYNRPGTPYGNQHGPFEDNLFRFSLLSMAALEAPLKLAIGGYRHEGVPGQPYGQDVIFIANDWHAAMVPVYMASRFQPHDVYKKARCVLALHNLAHQGSFPASRFGNLGLPGPWYETLDWTLPGNQGAKSLNILKAGLVTCDEVVTVSQNYAYEITQEDSTSGLHLLLQQRQKDIKGIVNGIDVFEWDPEKDPLIKAPYSMADLSGKAVCKRALQHALDLPIRERSALIGFIGRLDYQKGPDLLLRALPLLEQMDCQVVMLGMGAPDYEAWVREMSEMHPRWFRGLVEFDVAQAHRIMAGSDILLMPSRFEPCGLNQLYALRYGTLPVACSTGGLRDTIDDYNPFLPGGHPLQGTGWTFSPASVDAMMDALDTAIKLWREKPETWTALQRRGMGLDFSWDRAAQQYESVFDRVRKAPSYCQ